MSSMPLAQRDVRHAARSRRFCFAASAFVLIVATQARRLHPFVAIVLVASAFGLGRRFLHRLCRQGFWRRLLAGPMYSPGLVIVAAGFVSRSRRRDRRRRSAHRENQRFAAVRGREDRCASGAGRRCSRHRRRPPLRCSRLSFGRHGGVKPPSRGRQRPRWRLRSRQARVLWCSRPFPIAAAPSSMRAWSRVALFGLPVAVLLAGLGAAWSRWIATFGAASVSPAPESHPVAEKARRRVRGRAASGRPPSR